ncbi:hypothetical protein BJ508DRAFT_336464 [Ascobolus immersus RN42]|uniref:Uncharacterized protein n=1 Tax=Ascobolus immersus RN42 TaxID=1160509 RepID=A0A3N4H8G6_ASCIM|nr:hypothetical protein BJ508DRAFT_336464 [Ascobolus immersus RN42]
MKNTSPKAGIDHSHPSDTVSLADCSYDGLERRWIPLVDILLLSLPPFINEGIRQNFIIIILITVPHLRHDHHFSIIIIIIILTERREREPAKETLIEGQASPWSQRGIPVVITRLLFISTLLAFSSHKSSFSFLFLHQTSTILSSINPPKQSGKRHLEASVAAGIAAWKNGLKSIFAAKPTTNTVPQQMIFSLGFHINQHGSLSISAVLEAPNREDSARQLDLRRRLHPQSRS